MINVGDTHHMVDETQGMPENLPADTHTQKSPPAQLSDADLKQLKPYDSSGIEKQYSALSLRAGFSLPPLLLQLPDSLSTATDAISGVMPDGTPYVAMKNGFSRAATLAILAHEFWYLKNPENAPVIEAQQTLTNTPSHPLHHSISHLDLSALKPLTGGQDVATNDAPNHPTDGKKPNGRIIT